MISPPPQSDQIILSIQSVCTIRMFPLLLLSTYWLIPIAPMFITQTFTILETSKTELQLSVLKVLYIIKYQPALCKQKEFYNLLLFNPADYTVTKPDQVQEKENITNSSGSTFFPPSHLFFLLSDQLPFVYSSTLLAFVM